MDAATFAPSLSAYHRRWLHEGAGQQRWRVEDGTVVFLDITGFTELTERLAATGKVGGEELTERLNQVYEPIIGAAAALGGDVLKFGGDALLLLFVGPGHPERAGAAAWDMQRVIRGLRRMRTSAGVVTLQASCGAATGPIALFLCGSGADDLVVAGPTVTACLEAEAQAPATAVCVHETLAARLGGSCTSAARLGARPRAEPAPIAAPAAARASEELRGEHRQGGIAFVQFTGVDELLDREGPQPTWSALDGLMSAVQEACRRHGVTLIETDVDRNAGKILLCTGAPRAGEDDAGRLLRAAREITGGSHPLAVRAGVGYGRFFAAPIGAPGRRAYTIIGDAVNLAARVMAHAPDGRVLATTSVLESTRVPFAREPVPPFSVKGKSFPVEAALVGDVEDRAWAPDPSVPPGRDAEAVALEALLAGARAGAGEVLELTGEPGIGKTRLVDGLRAAAAADGFRTLTIEGAAYGAHAPYLALQAPLARLLGDEPLEAVAARHVRDAADWTGLLGPLLGQDLPLSARSQRLDADARRRRRQLAAAELLAGLLPAGRTLLVLEDAHLLDSATAELIDAVLSGPAARGWGVVITRRPVEGGLSPPARDWVRRLVVGALPDAAARAIVLGAVEGGFPPDAIDRLLSRGAGNPLVLRELAAAVRAGGDVDALPDTVEALLAAAIDRLPAGDRRLLQEASVLGVEFPRRALSDDADGVLERLSEFLHVEGDTVRFRHALIRAAAYEALSFRRRRELHGQALDAVGDAPELLALHAHHGGRAAEAWRWGRAAAARAMTKGSPTDAITAYSWAIKAGEQLGDVAPAELGAVVESHAEAAELAGRFELALASYGRARRLRRDQPPAAARLCSKQAKMCERLGRYREALGWATRGRRLLEGMPPGPAMEDALGLLDDIAGTVRWRQRRLDDAGRLLARAMHRLEGAGNQTALAHTAMVLASVESDRGQLAAADALSRRALALYEDAGDHGGAANVLNNMGIDAYFAGEWDLAAERMQRSLALRLEIGDVVEAAQCRQNLAALRSEQGRWAEAEPDVREALAIFRAAPRPEFIGLALATLGQVLARSGRTDEAKAALDEARAVLERIGAESLLLETLALEAERLVLAGQARAGLEAAEAAIARAERAEARHLLPALERTAAFALALSGDAASAERRMARALDLARSDGSPYQVGLTLHAIAQLDPEAPTPAAEAARVLGGLGVAAVATPRLR